MILTVPFQLRRRQQCGGRTPATRSFKQLAELTLKHRLPAIAWQREFADAGGLTSYGPSFRELWRRAASYVDKILKGAIPANIPVEQPTTSNLSSI